MDFQRNRAIVTTVPSDRRPDFANPTPELIESAKKNGIDLTDPAQRNLLIQMQREQERKERGDPDEPEPERVGSGRDGNQSLFWKTFFIVFSLAFCRILYVIFWRGESQHGDDSDMATDEL